jgi:diamine N-acetyltransferase
MLKGKNIVLRPLQDSDLDFLEKTENNKENWQFGSEQKKYNKQELTDYIAKAKTDIKVAKQYRFVIDLKGAPIGFIDLFDYTKKSAGVGVIISENYRNKGFAKEALMLLINYAFSDIKLKQLHCKITKANVASIHLFIACGFELVSQEQELQYFVKFV